MLLNSMNLYTLLGLLSAIIAYPFIIVSMVLSPWFSFYDNALSDLGNIALNGSVALLFNLGLILSGAMVTLFALFVTMRKRSLKRLSWTIFLTITGADLILIGVFTEDAGMIHMLVSVIFFISTIIMMMIYSCCSFYSRSSTEGIIALFLSIASIAVWIVKWPWRGVAIQETITSLIATIWLIILSLHEFKHENI